MVQPFLVIRPKSGLKKITCRGVNLGIYGTNLAREIGQSQTSKVANFTIHNFKKELWDSGNEMDQ